MAYFPILSPHINYSVISINTLKCLFSSLKPNKIYVVLARGQTTSLIGPKDPSIGILMIFINKPYSKREKKGILIG